MTRSSHSRAPLRLERLLDVLPDVGSMRPLLERLMATTAPDPERRWTTSGELGTTGGRIVDVPAFESLAKEWVEEEAERLRERARLVADVARALESGATVAVVDALLEGSGVLEGDGAAGDAKAWADAAFDVARREGHPGAPEALRRAARCARAMGDLDASARDYEEAYALALDHGAARDAVVAATGRGNVAVDRGRWADAERWYDRALELLAGDVTRDLGADEARALRWRLYQNLGITHRERGDLEASAAFYARAAEGAAGLGDPAATVEIENGRGQLALAAGEPRTAELHFRLALEAMDGSAPDPVRVAVRTNLGEALLRQGRTLEAGASGREAEAEAIRGRHVGRLPEVYRLLARVARARGEGEAFVLLDRTLDLVRDAGLPAIEELRTLVAYADLREGQGEHDIATELRVRAARIRRELDGARPEGPGPGDDDGQDAIEAEMDESEDEGDAA